MSEYKNQINSYPYVESNINDHSGTPESTYKTKEDYDRIEPDVSDFYPREND